MAEKIFVHTEPLRRINMNLLQIKDLTVEVEGRKVISNLNFNIGKGEVIALLGPNASGKSSLAKTIARDPRYKIKGGEIKFCGKAINKMSPEAVAKMGIAMTFQNPPQIAGLKLSDLIEKISRKKSFYKDGNILERDVNKNLSGGEKKLSELAQITALDPKLVILDELDSGLDMKKINEASRVVKEYFIDKGVSVLIITHHGDILEKLKPDFANIMISGQIVGRNEDYKKVLQTIKKYDYEKCKTCTRFLSEG